MRPASRLRCSKSPVENRHSIVGADSNGISLPRKVNPAPFKDVDGGFVHKPGQTLNAPQCMLVPASIAGLDHLAPCALRLSALPQPRRFIPEPGRLGQGRTSTIRADAVRPAEQSRAK